MPCLWPWQQRGLHWDVSDYDQKRRHHCAGRAWLTLRPFFLTSIKHCKLPSFYIHLCLIEERFPQQQLLRGDSGENRRRGMWRPVALLPAPSWWADRCWKQKQSYWCGGVACYQLWVTFEYELFLWIYINIILVAYFLHNFWKVNKLINNWRFGVKYQCGFNICSVSVNSKN